MAGKTVAFKQADVTRAVKGASAGGMQVGRAEIEPSGKITLIAMSEASEPISDLDKWLRKHAGQAQGN